MQNEVARDEAQYEALHANAVRLEQANQARPGLIAQQELDDAQAKDRAAEAQVESAKSALSAARQQLEMSQANNSQVSAMSDYTRIVAPFDGVVTWRYADTGALVQAGTSNSNSAPVVKLAQVNVLRLRIPVPESLAAIGAHRSAGRRDGAGHRRAFHRQGGALYRRARPHHPHHAGGDRCSQRNLQATAGNVRQCRAANPEPCGRADRARFRRCSTTMAKPACWLSISRTGCSRARSRLGWKIPTGSKCWSGLHEGDRVIVGNFGSFQAGQVVEPKVTTFDSRAGRIGRERVMSGFAIRYPFFIVMMCLIIAVVGVATVARMPVDLFPDINIPVVVVATFYNGMPPEQIEANITNPLRALLHAWAAASTTSNRAR